MKFVMYVDYLAGNQPQIEYKSLNAESLEAAIEEVEDFWWDNKEKIYLVRIMKKIGRTSKDKAYDCSYETYEAIMCKRMTWHRNTKENGENYIHRVEKWWLNNNKDQIWWENKSIWT